MNGLLLKLRDDHGSPGRTFWRCFEPLREILDSQYWIFPASIWASAPDGFVAEIECEEFAGFERTSVSLWRPGALGRWASDLFEESIEAWAIPDRRRAIHLATKTAKSFGSIELTQDAVFWLIYTDSFCWEIFAKQVVQLDAVRQHVESDPTITCYYSVSQNRERAIEKARLSHHQGGGG